MAAMTASTPSHALPRALRQSTQTSNDDLGTEILPAPPTLASIQHANLKRESHAKKPAPIISYLPMSDPGSTYTGGAGALAAGIEDDTRRRKRARLDKSLTSGRSQRASSRNMSLAAPSTSDVRLDDSRHTVASPLDQSVEDQIPVDSVDTRLPSRASSLEVLYSQHDEARGVNGLASKRPLRAKGKDKVSDRVKQEPVELPVPEVDDTESKLLMANHDHCSACRSVGSLLYCDSCPRAFHLWCLDPPLDHSEVPGSDSAWHCPGCAQHQQPPVRPTSSFLSPLIYVIQTSLPTEFTLPEEIRGYFKHGMSFRDQLLCYTCLVNCNTLLVTTGPRGSYKDVSAERAIRLNRLGFAEDRDPHRVKDRNGVAVLCFQCGKSSLPQNPLPTHGRATSTEHQSIARSTRTSIKEGAQGYGKMDRDWKSILSCDYCHLSWHLDCLSPPLTAMPSITRKWMCPNHAEQSFRNRRQPKIALPVTENRKAGLPNNGLIDVIPSEDVRVRNAVNVDEVLINGRIYRVPERVIIIDFWEKIRRKSRETEEKSITIDDDVLSSPLTSLSSLDDDMELPMQDSYSCHHEDAETTAVAQALCALRSSTRGPFKVDIENGLSHFRNNELVHEGVIIHASAESSSKLSATPSQDDLVPPLRGGSQISSYITPRVLRRSLSSELSSCPPSSEERSHSPPDGTSTLKIRIPRPLNMAVATASRKTAEVLPRRSLRRSGSTQKINSKAASPRVTEPNGSAHH